MFEGQIVCVIAGGPSLKGFDLSPVRDFPTIAVNNAWKIAPWAYLLHFADCPWWKQYGAEVKKKRLDKGLLVSTSTSDTGTVTDLRLMRLWRDRNSFTFRQHKVHGWDSGTQAVNIAFHTGARKIVLFGFDMRPAKDGSTHWHAEHARRTNVHQYKRVFLPSIRRSIETIKSKGVEVVTVTPSAIGEVCPQKTICEALELV